MVTSINELIPSNWNVHLLYIVLHHENSEIRKLTLVLYLIPSNWNVHLLSCSSTALNFELVLCFGFRYLFTGFS